MSRSYREPFEKDGGHRRKKTHSRAYRSRCKQVTKVFLKHVLDHRYGYDDDGIWIHQGYEWCECCGAIIRLGYWKVVIEDPSPEPEYPHPYEITNPYNICDRRIRVDEVECEFGLNGEMDYHLVDNIKWYKKACRK